MLERYFKQQLAESFQYRAIGSWWESKGSQNEIDIVALKLEKKSSCCSRSETAKEEFQTRVVNEKSRTFEK